MDLQIIDETHQVSQHQLNLVKDILEYAASYLDLPANTEMSVTLMNNEHIHQINKKYRGIDKPTDVISFAMEENNGEDEIIFPDDMDIEIPNSLGDLMVSMEKVVEQANYLGHSTDRELGFLVVHGFLHLNGYDHMKAEDEKEMFGLQDEILNGYGLQR